MNVDGKEFLLTPNVKEYKYEEEANNDCYSWYHILKDHTNHSRGKSLKLPAPKGMTKFWKYWQISTADFLAETNTFDIILFNNKNAGSQLIQAYSMSDFDHVGMVVRFAADPDEIYILEATNATGVRLVKFSDIIPYLGQYYDKVCVRHLGFERSDE